jgi:hypothetical protein
LAVIAITGTPASSGFTRIRCVASFPVITGICTSMSTA